MQMISKCLVNTLFQNPTMNYLLMNIIILNSHKMLGGLRPLLANINRGDNPAEFR